MPKIAFYKFMTFFFYAFDLRERRHVHVEVKKGKNRNPAKIWFENGIVVAEKGNLNKRELNLAVKLISSNLDLFNKQFNSFIHKGKIKPVQLKLK